MISSLLLNYKKILLLPIVTLLFVSCLNSSDQGDLPDQIVITLGFPNINDNIIIESDTISIVRLRLLVGNVILRNSGSDTLLINQTAFQITHQLSNNEIRGLASGTFNSDAVFEIFNFEIKQAEQSDIGSNSNVDNDFVEGESENERYSMIINGSYNGEAFEFKSARNFNFSFTIDNESNSQGTLLYNLPMRSAPADWFMSPINNELLNPGNPDNASLINNNIQSSMTLE